VLGASPGRAGAYFDEETPLLDRTAYALHQGQFRVGLFNQSVGIFDQLTVGTLTLPWVLPLLIDRFGPNAFVESAFFEQGKHAVSLRVGVTYVALTDGGSAAAWIVPITAAYSVRWDEALSTHARATYSGIFAGADAGQEEQQVEGNALIDMVQLDGTVEWRLTDNVALLGIVHWAPWAGAGVADVQAELGPAISAEGELDLDTSDLQHAWNVTLALAMSLSVADLRIGFGYGDPFLLDTGVILPLDGFFPEIDLSFRFP